MSALPVAIAQPQMCRDVGRNGRTVRRLMQRAAEGGARLIHFPEGMLSGYAKAQVHSWDDLDWPALRHELELVSRLAGELSLWVVLGCAHPLTSPHRPHNSVYVISDTGALVDRYDKRLCSHTEVTQFYTPGFEPVVFEVDGFRFGCAICFEINFPELFSEYEKLGVDCVLVSAYPPDSIFATKARAHAAINNYWVSLSVPAQSAELFCSRLIGPDGQLLAEVAVDADLVLAELDRDAPELQSALAVKRPWRTTAREGQIYEDHRVHDDRSRTRTQF